MAEQTLPYAGEVRIDNRGDRLIAQMIEPPNGALLSDWKEIRFSTEHVLTDYGISRDKARILRVTEHFVEAPSRDREPSIEEAATFAAAARDQFPDDPISQELFGLVRSRVLAAANRLGVSAAVGARAEG